MPIDDLIITVYCIIDEMYQDIVKDVKLRKRGPVPSLRDTEVLTMLVVGEYLGLGDDKNIWSYFSRHWLGWFPELGCRTSFIRQSANLLGVYSRMQEVLSSQLGHQKDLFLDLVKERNFNAPTQPEKRERKFLELLKKHDKPVVLFIDEAHDLHGQTLISLKRLIELSDDAGKALAVIVAGHPKLGNELKRSSMEEVGARTQIFTLSIPKESHARYCEWLLKQCSRKETKQHDIILPEALELLSNSLVTPLQVNYYLAQALEKSYLAGCKPVTVEIIQSVLAPDLDGLEAKLARNGYSLGALCEALNAKSSDVKTYLRGQLTSSKSQEFNQEIHKLGII